MGWLLNLFLIFAGLIFINTYQAPTVCENPIAYKIGIIDSRFKMTRQDLLTDLEEGESAWEKSTNHELFHYRPSDPDALVVRMVYDDRQQHSTDVSEFQNKVQSDKQGLEPKLQEYENHVRDFERRLDEFNKKIDSFNQRHDITEEEYNQLIAEQNALKQEAENLNATARELNRTTEEYNLEVGKLGEKIQEFKQVIEAKPEQGLYDGPNNTITLYFHTDRSELIHTIEHELGHALGIDHLSNLDAVMFAKTNKTIVPTQDDIAEVERLCERKTLYENLQKVDWKKRLDSLLYNVRL